MRYLRKCDLFRQVQDKENHLTAATPCGALMSALTMVVLAILLVGELFNYFHGHSSCRLAPRPMNMGLSPAEASAVRRLEMEVSFAHIPCDRIGIEILSSTDGRRLSELESLAFTRLYGIPKGSYNAESALMYLPGVMGIEKMGCLVKTIAPLPNGPCSVNVILQNSNTVNTIQYPPDHKIHKMYFGDEPLVGVVPQITHTSTHSLEGKLSELPTRPPIPYLFQYFVNLTPTSIDMTNGNTKHGFQYTAFSTVVGMHVGHAIAPGLYMNCQESGYAMECAVTYDSVPHFLVNLCAAIGGVYTVASMIETVLESILRQRQREERAALHALNTEKAKMQQLMQDKLGDM